MDPQLIDRIYECAFLPDFWAGLLDDLARIAGARGGVLFTANPALGILRWAASPILAPGMQTYAADGWLQRGKRLAQLQTVGYAGFVRDADLMSEEELADDPTYRDFLRPLGLGRAAGTCVSLPTSDVLVFSFERASRLGPVPDGALLTLDALRPHLARSALLAGRLHLERARSASDTLGLLGIPALVFDALGAVSAVNTLMERLGDHIRWRPRDRVALKDQAADQLLRQAMDGAAIEGDGSVRSFPIRDGDGAPVFVAHTIPIRRAAGDIFGRCAGLLVLTPVTMPSAPPVELIQSLFDLTPAEARVARSLTSGATVDQIAADGAVSANTVRTQVRGLLEKTGCRRQTEVVALLGAVVAPPAN